MEVIMKRTPYNRSLRRSGFTLVEVLLVLAILGVIAAMVVPNLMSAQRKAMIKSTQVNIAGFEGIAKQYMLDHDGDWPPNVGAMTNPPPGSDNRAIAPYVEKIPKDAWNQPLFYEFPSGK